MSRRAACSRHHARRERVQRRAGFCQCAVCSGPDLSRMIIKKLRCHLSSRCARNAGSRLHKPWAAARIDVSPRPPEPYKSLRPEEAIWTSTDAIPDGTPDLFTTTLRRPASTPACTRKRKQRALPRPLASISATRQSSRKTRTEQEPAECGGTRTASDRQEKTSACTATAPRGFRRDPPRPLVR